jgi:hypothetical protein
VVAAGAAGAQQKRADLAFAERTFGRGGRIGDDGSVGPIAAPGVEQPGGANSAVLAAAQGVAIGMRLIDVQNERQIGAVLVRLRAVCPGVGFELGVEDEQAAIARSAEARCRGAWRASGRGSRGLSGPPLGNKTL